MIRVSRAIGPNCYAIKHNKAELIDTYKARLTNSLK